MRDYGKIAPSFWIGDTGRKIIQSGPEATIVALYLMTSPHANMLGLYYLPVAYISHDTGLPSEGALKGLQWACEAGLCGYDNGAQVVWVYEMARFQTDGVLKSGDKRIIGVNREYQKLPKCLFLGYFFDKYKDSFHLETRRGFKAPCKPLRSQEQEQEQEYKEVFQTSVGQGGPTTLATVDHQEGNQPKPDPVPYTVIIAKLNEVCGCQFKASTQATRRHIKARWNEGWRLPDFEAVVAAKFEEWGSDAEMCRFLRPETLFGTKFESYLQFAKNGGGAARPLNESTAPANQDELVRKIREQRAERERKALEVRENATTA